MDRSVIVRGRLHGRRIDLDEAVDELDGEVEVLVRPVARAVPANKLLDLVAPLPCGSRTKDEIDAQIDDERASWDRRG